ncbi:hypothetical protein D3C78_1142140 [compost metagenome]
MTVRIRPVNHTQIRGQPACVINIVELDLISSHSAAEINRHTPGVRYGIMTDQAVRSLQVDETFPVRYIAPVVNITINDIVIRSFYRNKTARAISDLAIAYLVITAVKNDPEIGLFSGAGVQIMV